LTFQKFELPNLDKINRTPSAETACSRPTSYEAFAIEGVGNCASNVQGAHMGNATEEAPAADNGIKLDHIDYPLYAEEFQIQPQVPTTPVRGQPTSQGSALQTPHAPSTAAQDFGFANGIGFDLIDNPFFNDQMDASPTTAHLTRPIRLLRERWNPVSTIGNCSIVAPSISQYPIEVNQESTSATGNVPPHAVPVSYVGHIQKQAESFITSTESIAAQTTNSLALLKEQYDMSFSVYYHCLKVQQDYGVNLWGTYLKEIRVHYDGIRDHLWVALKTLSQCINEWFQEYRQILDPDTVNRGVLIMRRVGEIKTEIDAFRYPVWDDMVTAHLINDSKDGIANLPEKAVANGTDVTSSV
jgi:hypothetical protein